LGALARQETKVKQPPRYRPRNSHHRQQKENL